MANFGERETLPQKYEDRNIYIHNPQVTLVRTNPEESAELGRILAEKINAYKGPVTVLLPLEGISIISREGQPFYDADADKALFDSIRDHLNEGVKVVEIDDHVNSPRFSKACANELLSLIQDSA